MRRITLSAVLVLACLATAVPAEAAIITEAKVLFSPIVSNVGMTVTQSGSDPNDYFLTFAPMVIDAAVINGSQVAGDPCEGWDVLFGPMVVDATSRTVVGGMFALYDIVAAPGHTTLTVKDGGTTRLSATLTPQSKLLTYVSGTIGGLDTQAADLTGLVFDLTGVTSQPFDEFAKRTDLDFGFAYSGLDLDKILNNRLAGGLAGATGHIQLPEPATLALLGLGGLVAAWRRKRQ
jgi:hypothetical protein